MSKIVKLHILNALTSKAQLFQVLFPVIVAMLVYFGAVVTDESVLLFKLFSANIAIFMMAFSVAIGNISIAEKLSARLEYYLANNVNVQKIFYAHAVSTFALSFVSVLSLNVFLLAYSKICNEKLFAIVCSFYGVVGIFLCAIVGFAISLLMNVLVLVIKDAAMIRMISFFMSMVVIFGTSFLIQLFGGLVPNVERLSNRFALIFATVSFIIYVIYFLVKPKISNERIILSSRQ